MPEPIVPKNNLQTKEEIIGQIKESRQTLIGIVESDDNALTCLDFIHQAFGELTRAEWVYFIIYHSQRHL